MSITQQGAINTTALIVPDLYVQVVPPQVATLNGVPTNVLGLVGTASWGPVNSPVVIGSMADFARQFGAIMARLYDLGTAVAAAVLQGANNFRCVRVTDGSDVAASVVVQSTCITFASLYSGSLANADTVTIGTGSAASSYKVTVARAGRVPEVFDNITGSGNALWVNIAQAINNGQGALRGPSKLIKATAGVGTTAPTLAAYTLTGGTDGASLGTASAIPIAAAAKVAGGTGYAANDTITLAGGTFTTAAVITVLTVTAGVIQTFSITTAGSYSVIPTTATQGATSGSGSGATFTLTGAGTAALLGQDTSPRSGMYALRNTGVSVAALVDCFDTATFSTQVAFGLSEGVYMIGVSAPGDTIANATSVKSSAGIDFYAFKYLFGDWVYFNDTVNNQVRMISPQGFVAGKLVALSPEQSTLNKPLYGIVATQKSSLNQFYSGAELQLLIGAGIDLITNPVPGGNYFGVRAGHNSSSNPLTNGDNYTRLTNYVAGTLNAGMGQFIGQMQTTSERATAKAVLENFLQNLLDAGMIGDVNGGPAYSVQLDAANNPSDRVAKGYQQADVKIKYLSVVEKFLVNVEGSTATVIPSGNPALAA